MRLAFAVAVSLFAFLSPAHARAQADDPQIYAYVDAPYEGATYAPSGIRGPQASGWAFHCAFGSQVQSIKAYYRDDTQTWVQLTPWYRTGTVFQAFRQYRPDIMVFQTWCPLVNEHEGFGFSFLEAIPSGPRLLMFVFEDKTGRATIYRNVVIE